MGALRRHHHQKVQVCLNSERVPLALRRLLGRNEYLTAVFLECSHVPEYPIQSPGVCNHIVCVVMVEACYHGTRRHSDASFPRPFWRNPQMNEDETRLMKNDCLFHQAPADAVLQRIRARDDTDTFQCCVNGYM